MNKFLSTRFPVGPRFPSRKLEPLLAEHTGRIELPVMPGALYELYHQYLHSLSYAVCGMRYVVCGEYRTPLALTPQTCHLTPETWHLPFR